MSFTIEESGMLFGPFEESSCYRIERSKLFQSVSNCKTVEFLWKKKKSVWFVEAKSSAPDTEHIKSDADAKERIDAFTQEISEKFLHSLNLYCAALLKRHERANDMPELFRTADYANMGILLILVIKGYSEKGLKSIEEILKRKLLAYVPIWRLEIKAINEQDAAKYGLIRNP